MGDGSGKFPQLENVCAGFSARRVEERCTQSRRYRRKGLGVMSEHETSGHGDYGDHFFCPTNAVLTLLSGRWTLHIVRALLDGRARFNDIARAQGINPRTLRERLRELEEEGVVTRTVVSLFPPHVEYALTEKGRALNGVFEALAAWGLAWMRPKGAELVGGSEETEACDTLSSGDGVPVRG